MQMQMQKAESRNRKKQQLRSINTIALEGVDMHLAYLPACKTPRDLSVSFPHFQWIVTVLYSMHARSDDDENQRVAAA